MLGTAVLLTGCAEQTESEPLSGGLRASAQVLRFPSAREHEEGLGGVDHRAAGGNALRPDPRAVLDDKGGVAANSGEVRERRLLEVSPRALPEGGVSPVRGEP